MNTDTVYEPIALPGGHLGDRDLDSSVRGLLSALDTMAAAVVMFEVHGDVQALLRACQPGISGSTIHCVPFMCAREFAGGLRLIGRFLEHWSKSRPELSVVHDFYRKTFQSDPKDVRDAAQHVDERLRGMTKEGPVRPGPQFIGDIHGDAYVWTRHDGSHASVHVNRTTLALARDCVQMATSTLRGWSGSPGPHPPPRPFWDTNEDSTDNSENGSADKGDEGT